MNILEFKNVSITYQEGKTAVQDVSFPVPEKSIVAIVGESGSGKSTLVRSVIDLLGSGGRISGGEVLFEGRSVMTFSAEEMRRIRGGKIAMIFQDAGSYLNPRVKIGKQFMEMLSAHLDSSRDEQKQLAGEMLRKLKLSEPERIMNSYPFQLSGGMRQRVGIAMAVSMKPRILLADEPTSALDVTVQAQVVQELLGLRDEYGTSILIVTHNMGVASRMADYIAVMKDGRLMEFGTRDQIIYSPSNDYTKMLLSVVPKLEEKMHGR